MSVKVVPWTEPTVDAGASILRLEPLNDTDCEEVPRVFYIHLSTIEDGLPLRTDEIVTFKEHNQAQVVPTNYAEFQNANDDHHHWGWQSWPLCRPGELGELHQQVFALGEGFGLWINPDDKRVYIGREKVEEVTTQPILVEVPEDSQSRLITPQMTACLTGDHVAGTKRVGVAGLGLGPPSQIVSCVHCAVWFEPKTEKPSASS